MDVPLVLRSTKLVTAGFAHGFFTRQGGVSEAPFDSLHFAWKPGCEAKDVRENLARAATVLGVQSGGILFVSQVHGVDSHWVGASDGLDACIQRQGDCVLSEDSRVACAVRVADCAPVLIGDAETGAVAAVHSGWRGTQQNIVGHAIKCLVRGRSPKGLVAAVGPHIEACCFEVGHEVGAELSRVSPVGGLLHLGSRGRVHVDLRRILHGQLLEAGVASERIDHVRGCSKCDPIRFFSYRRDGDRSGRMLAAIVARPQPKSLQPSVSSNEPRDWSV